MSPQDLFELGMKRKVPEIRKTFGYAINLGAGPEAIPDAVSYDLPDWDANTMAIPEDDGTVHTVHAYHFMEHVDDPFWVLSEIQRVLCVGGVANIVVPYYTSQMAYQDPTHRTWWTEETWAKFFDAPYWRSDSGTWQLEVGFNMIMGIVERNTALVTQLIKVDK